MRIEKIIRNLNYISLNVPEPLRGREIVSLCQNSRQAHPTCLFFCKRGALTDGHRYARHAYDNGARFFVVEREVDLPADAAIITVPDSSEALRHISPIFYGHPASNMRLIGITGTKGKTTVALSVYHVARSKGVNIGYIGTNGVIYGEHKYETANTTPDCLELQRTLREMCDCGVTDVVIEVSSQALWQKRTYGLQFDICAFTNLYEDHIGGVEHPDMEHYMNCKRLLLTDYSAKNIVINSDSDVAEHMLEGVSCENIVTTSAKGNDNCDLFARNPMKIKSGNQPGVSFELLSGNSSPITFEEHGVEAFIPIPGLYSVENGLLTVAICSLMGIDQNAVVDELSRLSVSGRFETVQLESKPDSLFVIDYAHNGASLTAVLNSLREYDPKRIIVVFGSVGGRTFGRREELAKAAEKGADVIIITSDNPNNEDPMDVISEINSHITSKDTTVHLIPDRKDAIAKAYEIAEDGDIVLLAGKGHEDYQLIMGERVPFSERKILKKLDLLNLVY